VNSLLHRCGCSTYAVLADEIVTVIRMKEQELCNMKPQLAAAHGFKVGQQVRIEEGPFSGYFAKIETLDDDGRIGLLMSLFGRDSRVSKFPSEYLASAP
jgi:transcription antitermination factor NusG